MVRLELRLVKHLHTQHFDGVLQLVDIVIEDFKVKQLVKFVEHLLKAKLMVKLLPRKVLWVLNVSRLAVDFSVSQLWLLLLHKQVTESVLMSTDSGSLIGKSGE